MSPEAELLAGAAAGPSEKRDLRIPAPHRRQTRAFKPQEKKHENTLFSVQNVAEFIYFAFRLPRAESMFSPGFSHRVSPAADPEQLLETFEATDVRRAGWVSRTDLFTRLVNATSVPREQAKDWMAFADSVRNFDHLAIDR